MKYDSRCCTTGVSCFCLPAFVDTRVGHSKNDSWHLCNAVWQNLVLCLLFCRHSRPYRGFSDGNLHIKISAVYVRFMNGNQGTTRRGVFLCLISLSDAVWDVDFIILLWCVCVCVCVSVFVRTCASWGQFEFHPGWVLPRSERSSWPTLCPSSPAPTWSVSEYLPPAPMPAASQVQPGTNIHSHKSIIRTHNLNTFGVCHTCALFQFQLDGNTQRHKHTNGCRQGCWR